MPQTSADSFELLHRAGLIPVAMMENMKGMVGFRDVLVHQYTTLDRVIMTEIIKHHLHEPLEFANLALSIIE